tara:strand:- start:147 stop:731 length:585 start_codon:yes stop_codon:yes gene_type:complete
LIFELYQHSIPTKSSNQILWKSLLFLWVLFLLECSVTGPIFWPDKLPELAYFEANYKSDKDNQLVQSKADYLGWVVSFYEGTLIAPVGWMNLQSMVLAMAEPEDRLELGKQLTELGRLISGEWAKENDKRVIDSRLLSLWGSVMQLSDGPQVQAQAILLIEKDVNALLNRQLTPESITDERYEGVLGIDLFGGF